MEDVLLYPRLKDIGSIERQVGLAHAVVDNIYLAFGKNMEMSQQERDLAAKRFAEKSPFSTIGDLFCFSDMVMDGTITVEKNYLSLITFFQAWRDYQAKRGDMIFQKERLESETKKQEDISYEDVSGLIKDIQRRFSNTSNLWDEYLASRPKGWVMKTDRNGVNQEFAEYKQQRLKEESL